MNLTERAETLYALPLNDFVAARNAAAQEAKLAGDKDLAAALRALPKPSSAAWLVNVLVARRREEVGQVLELGASLKEAQAGLDRAQLQALGQQRQRLLAAVARESLAAAADAGHEVGEAALPAVEQTLRAALADPAAAAAVLSGRLVRPLEATGWDPVDLAGAVGGPFTAPAGEEPGTRDEDEDDDARPAAAGGATTSDSARSAARAARRRKQAEAALTAARESREAAEVTRKETRRRADRAMRERDGVAASIADLEQQLTDLRRTLAGLVTESSELERVADEARAELEEAQEDEDAAREDLEALDA